MGDGGHLLELGPRETALRAVEQGGGVAVQGAGQR
jgi:hypothetical protein